MKRLPYKTWTKNLVKARNKGKINPCLDKALEAIIKALMKQDWDLACQLTAVKSHISDVIDPKSGYSFQENHRANEKTLGTSLYSMLDGMHHTLAFSLDEIPSGMMVMGTTRVPLSKRTRIFIKDFRSKNINHPVIKQIRLEQQKSSHS
jgi:hypothetical protein